MLENQNPGTTSWKLTLDHKALNQEIEGYASKTSVNKGSSIDLMVNLSTNSTQYTMDIYRLGWYPTGTNPDGSSCAPSCGGRLMLHVGPLTGSRQAACPQVTTQNDPNFGLTECNWTPSYTLNVPASWTSGTYLVKLKRADGQQLENYMTFVVRDDASTAAVLYSLDVTTWNAYNYWGGSGNNHVGYSLYGRYNDITGDNTGNRAFTVSFDRPYQDGAVDDGAGKLFDWDYPMIRYLESQGFDMTYATSIDLESNPSLVAAHRVFVNVGHDEYYSDNMRNQIKNAIAGGTDMAFFSANNFYYRITWAPNGAGAANRRIHATRTRWRDRRPSNGSSCTPSLPENQIGGVMLQGVANDRPFLVADENSWIYAGTGLHTYTGNGTNNVITSGANQNALAGDHRLRVRRPRLDDAGSLAVRLGRACRHDHRRPLLRACRRRERLQHVERRDAVHGAERWRDGLLRRNDPVVVERRQRLQRGYCGCSPGSYANLPAQRVTSNIINRFIAP